MDVRPLLTLLLALVCALGAAVPAHAARAWGADEPLDPAIGSLADTKAAVTWNGVAVTWAADGAVWGAVVPGMAPTRLGSGRNVDVHAAKANGTVLFTWTDGSGDVGDDQGYARVLGTGGLGDVEALGQQATWLPLTDVGPWGDMAIASGTGGRVLVRSRSWTDGAWTGPVDLGAGRPEAIGATGNHEVVVAYERAGALRVARVQHGVVTADDPVPGAEPGAVAVPHVALDDAGAALLVVLQPRPAGAPMGLDEQGHPLLAVRAARGGAWTAVPEVAGWALGASVATGSAEAAVVWSEQRTLEPGPLRMVLGRPGTGAFAAPVTLDPGPTSDARIDVALDASTLITYGSATGLRAIRREGSGPFSASSAVSCPGDFSPLIGAGVQGALPGVVVRGKDGSGLPVRVLRDEDAPAPADLRCAGPAAPPAGPGGGGATTTFPPAPGATPSMTAVKGQRLRRVLRKGLRLSLVVPQAGTPTLTVVLPRAQARRYGLGRKAVTVARKALRLEAGRNAVTVKLGSKARRRLAKARRVTLRVEVRSPFGLVFRTPVTLKR